MIKVIGTNTAFYAALEHLQEEDWELIAGKLDMDHEGAGKFVEAAFREAYKERRIQQHLDKIKEIEESE